MQIHLHSDPNTDGSHLMAEHFATVVNAAMGRFGERVTRVEAHLSDVNGQAKSSGDDIHCTLEASLNRFPIIRAKKIGKPGRENCFPDIWSLLVLFA